MGFFGSIHCAAMCGPLLLAIPGKHPLWNKLLYQIGRILMYTLIGFLMGLLGNIALLKGGQQWLSLLTGVLLIGIGMFTILGKYNNTFARWQSLIIQPFAQIMGKWLFKPGGSFFAGVLNGMLPCGMVYMALAAALNADSIANSTLFMMLFGLGTLPLLLSISIAAQFAKKVFKKGFTRYLAYVYLVMGCWFILRGANLDIPYISPLLHLEGAMNCSF